MIALGALVLPPDESPKTADFDWLLKLLRFASGCYVLLIEKGDTLELATDAAGISGVYYADGNAASSPTLVSSSPLAHSDECHRRANTRRPDDWTLGSATPFPGVKWLYPNHFLSVETGRIRRFWPSPLHWPPPRMELALDRVSDYIRHSVQLTTKLGEPLLSITGGKDSRINLAASLGNKDQFQYFTINSPRIKECDYAIPMQLASTYGLNHRFIPVVPAKREHLIAYDEISSGLAQGARREIISTSEIIGGPKKIHINGNLGALCKAYYWPRRLESTVSEKVLLREFATADETTKQGLKEWLATLPAGLPLHVYYNLMYLEQRAGRWMGPGENASSIFYSSFTPFSSRFFFEEVSRLPCEYQRSGNMLVDLADSIHPGITKLPYCKSAHSITRYFPGTIRGWARRLKGLWYS